MSLIVDINPVPWRILDLVKARILKNRAKKAKKGTDWSKETLKREMSLRPGPLISKRRDEPSFLSGRQVAVGVGWSDIGYNYTFVSDNYQNFDTGWSNGVPQSELLPNWDPDTGPTTRISGYSGSEEHSLEFVITVGSGSGETWKQVRHSLPFIIQKSSRTEVTYYEYYLYGDVWTILSKERNSGSQSHNCISRFWHELFPVGPSEAVLVVVIANFSLNGAFFDEGEQPDDPTPRPPGTDSNYTSFPGTFALQSTKQISFLVTRSSVTELTHAIPAFIQKRIDSVMAQPLYDWRNVDEDNPDIRIERANPLILSSPNAIGTYKTVRLPSGISQGVNPAAEVSSAIYESIAPDGTFSVVSPEQAKASYAEYSGNSEIPVLSYKLERDPTVISAPTTEVGVFGIVPGASVTEPVTTEMLAVGLDDEVDQRPGPSAVNQPEPVRMFAAYDYHEGTYCRNRLSQLLGIDIP